MKAASEKHRHTSETCCETLGLIKEVQVLEKLMEIKMNSKFVKDIRLYSTRNKRLQNHSVSEVYIFLALRPPFESRLLVVRIDS